jgi:hypothetical protein
MNDVFDIFFKKFAYKFPKGYPDINNPKDKVMLFELINNIIELEDNMIKEGTESYDKRIQSVLQVDEIPKCNTPLSVGENFNLRGKDEEIWDLLYPVKPLKADSQTPTAGSGNGEIATYWAYQHNINPIEAKDGRSGEDPDLIIGGIGVEVKSYDTKIITLGKFAADTETINLLNKVFGTLILFSGEPVKANTGNFGTQNLLNGFEIVGEIYNNEDLKKLPITKPFFDKIEKLYNILELESNVSPEQATVTLLRKLLWTKLAKKPNRNQEVGYILNVNAGGKGEYIQITKDIIDNIPNENILNNGITVKSSEIQMNFNKLFK